MSLAAEINPQPCGCYTRCADGKWFANPECRIHSQPAPPAPVTVTCRACGGTGTVSRGYGAWNGREWVGGGIQACDGCHGAGVHRL